MVALPTALSPPWRQNPCEEKGRDPERTGAVLAQARLSGPLPSNFRPTFFCQNNRRAPMLVLTEEAVGGVSRPNLWAGSQYPPTQICNERVIPTDQRT